MLILHRSIKLRTALCLVPKNNFPTLSTLSWGGEYVHIFLCVCALLQCEDQASPLLHLFSLNIISFNYVDFF